MAATPRFKVYNRDGEYIAATRYPDDAAVLAGARGEGTTVRLLHGVRDTVWREGAEEFSASESYDGAAATMLDRLESGERAPKS